MRKVVLLRHCGDWSAKRKYTTGPVITWKEGRDINIPSHRVQLDILLAKRGCKLLFFAGSWLVEPNLQQYGTRSESILEELLNTRTPLDGGEMSRAVSQGMALAL